MIFKIQFSTEGNTDIINITELVESKIKESKIKDGIVNIFIPGATGGLTTMEYEQGLIIDTKEMFKNLIPEKQSYHHDASHSLGNAHSHLRATLLGPSLVIPFEDYKLKLGRWQQVVFIDFDNRPRQRELFIKIIEG